MNSMTLEITEDMKKIAWKFRRKNAAVKRLTTLVFLTPFTHNTSLAGPHTLPCDQVHSDGHPCNSGVVNIHNTAIIADINTFNSIKIH